MKLVDPSLVTGQESVVISASRVAAIAVFLTSLSGLPLPVSARQTIQEPAASLPEWVRTRELAEYPADAFLIGLGVAHYTGSLHEAVGQAESRSRADIAKQIRSHIRQVLRDSLTEERFESVLSLHRIRGATTVHTEESTELHLEGVEVVRQWIGSDVYVLSVLDRKRAIARATMRAADLENQLQADFKEVRSILVEDPLLANTLADAARGRASDLVMQYEILSGVARTLQLPPAWLSELDALVREARGAMRSAILIRATVDGVRRIARSTYPAIEALVVEMGWSVLRLDSRQYVSATVAELKNRLARDGVRYVLLMDAESRETEAFRLGHSTMHFARAGGTLELIDLADGAIEMKVNYPFPAETKSAHRDRETAQRSAVASLFEIMLGDLSQRLQGGK